ncbi:MAG TPA: FAD-binding oxidoreductase [Rhodanobacteraceae bacterium]|nr:FAD-binding oxidoreductase [Rhodanobacteraceae bacterium]
MRVGFYASRAPTSIRYAPLSARAETRVAIVGGGFAGLNTARSLLDRGVREVVLLEAEQIGFGASGRNGGFVFAGYSLGEQSLLQRVGEVAAKRLFGRSVAAVNLIRERIARFGIDCDLVDAGVIWANWFRDPAVLRRRQRLLSQHYGVEWQWLPQAELRQQLCTERYGDGLFERNAMHLDPLRYALGLASSLSASGQRVHEDSPALALTRHGQGWRITTPQGVLDAEQVVLACGGYLAGLERRVDRSILPIATYVMVTAPLGPRLTDSIRTRAAIYDTRFAFDYYRVLNDTRLLWGGRISIRNRDAGAVQRLLRRDLARVYPQLAEVPVDHAWSGLMSYARHEMPQIGGNGQGLWWAQAFGGHGLAPTAVAGELLAAAVADGDPGWREFAAFGLVESFRPFGYLAAQGSYWWAGARDAMQEWREK